MQHSSGKLQNFMLFTLMDIFYNEAACQMTRWEIDEVDNKIIFHSIPDIYGVYYEFRCNQRLNSSIANKFAVAEPMIVIMILFLDNKSECRCRS